MSGRGDFSRQSFLGADAEQIFADTRVAIVGLGGGGSHIAQQLAHLGVGHFRLIDPDQIEGSNLNRLVTATQEDVDEKRRKVRILERTIRSVRPWADVIVAEEEWQRSDDLVRDAHVVFGCIDGYRRRLDLERATRRFGQPYIDIGMDVAEIEPGKFAIAGQVILSLPSAPCMTCMGFLTRERLNQEESDYGAAGGHPQVVWSNGILASLAVGIFVQLMTPWRDTCPEYIWLEYDGNRHTVKHSLQPKFNIKGPCAHFAGAEDLGDPNFSLKAK